jgi:hypothetical protein
VSKQKSEKEKVVTSATEKTVPSAGSVTAEMKPVVEQKKNEETKETKSCGKCRYYDISTERGFRRDGIRKGLVETRAVCRADKTHAKASGHLIKKESSRPCFELGTYVGQVKEKKQKTQPPKTETKQTTEKPVEHKDQSTRGASKEQTRTKVASMMNILTGETKLLQTKGLHSDRVFVKAFA